MNKEDLLKEGFEEVESVVLGDVWNFDEKPVARGVFMGKQEKVGPNKSMMYHFIDDDGDAYSVWGTTVLNDRLGGIEVGETVIIQYEGKQQSKDGGSYKAYTVLHKMVPGALEKAKSAGGTAKEAASEEGEPTPF